jgi:DNA-binding beta-propeller fold protein YncE
MDRTGKFLRQWQPEDMMTVHCLSIANDGQVYVCNRENARIQIYDKMGNFKKSIEVPWKPVTPPKDGKIAQSGGSSVALDFSHDAAQQFIFLINQNNAQVEIIDRQSGKILSSFGRPGTFPGEFNQPHGIAVDSKNNVYIAENRGRRIHKFKVSGQ